ncbi:MAG: type II toxin-antitoxin system HicA family toxin [Rickettsiales bacterium]|jgi:hypothetical protein
MNLNNKQRKTLEAIFAKPTRANILWTDVEKLFIALGGEVIEGKGSAIKILIDGELAYFHRPHQSKEAKHYRIDDARRFLRMLECLP